MAYVSCGHVFVWTPGTQEVIQADPDDASMSPSCATPNGYITSFHIYGLALAGDRVAFGGQEGNMSKYCWLGGTTLAPQPTSFELNSSGPGCPYGNLAGSGSLLVFSSWQLGSYPYPITEETIRLAQPGGCPCPGLRTDHGPLVPFDVDGTRTVAGGQNATVLLDAAGQELLSIPVPSLSAQLSGSDLVVLTQGAVNVYNAGSGALVHIWPVPDVPSGGECQMALGDYRDCPTVRLLLEDASHGLVAYVLDGQVHLLRLADGKDQIVGAGKLARFMDAGLVYADGSRLHLVPFDRLPLD